METRKVFIVCKYLQNWKRETKSSLLLIINPLTSNDHVLFFYILMYGEEELEILQFVYFSFHDR